MLMNTTIRYMEIVMIAKCVRNVFIVLCFDVIKKRGYFYPRVIYKLSLSSALSLALSDSISAFSIS